MQKMIDELTAMTAEKYGDTDEGYRQILKADGKTPFDEFAQAADDGVKTNVDYTYNGHLTKK